MAKVPQYQQQVGASQGPTPQVNVQTNQAAFGGGKDPRAAQAAVGAVVDEFAKYRMQADESNVIGLDSEALKITNRMIFDPKDGIMSKRGKNAFGIDQEYIPKFDAAMNELMAQTNNDRQKALLAPRIAQYKLKLEADMAKHMGAQGTVVDKEAVDSGIEAAKNDALLNFSDQGAVRAAVEKQKGLIKWFGDNNGMPDDWTQNEITKNVSETHISVVDRMVDLDQPNQAKEYYNTYKGEISGKDQARIEKNLQTGTVKLESQVASDAIFNKGLTMSAALSEARKIESPELRDETVRRVKDRYEEVNTAERVQREINVNAARRGLAQNGGNLDTAISPSVFNTFDASTQKELQTQASMIQTGRPFVTNPTTRYDLEQLAATQPDKFREMDLVGTAGSKLSPDDLNYFSKMQAGLNGSTAEGDKMRNGVLTKQQILDQSLVEFGINPKDKAKKDSVAQLNLRINDAIVQWQDDNGKTAGPKEIRDITESFLVEARRGGDGSFFKSLIQGTDVDWSSAFGGSVPLAEIDPANTDYTIPYENISLNTRRRIESALKQAGRPVTPKNVEAAFKERAKALRGSN